MAGPTTKPRPIAMPTMPMPLARSAPLVVSETAAEAIEMLPAMMPPRTRAPTSRAKVPAKNHST